MHVSVLEACELTRGMGSTETIPWISCKLEQEHLPIPVLCSGHAGSSPSTCFSSKHRPLGAQSTSAPSVCSSCCRLCSDFLRGHPWPCFLSAEGSVATHLVSDHTTFWWQWLNHLRDFQKFHSHGYSSPRPFVTEMVFLWEKSCSNGSIIAKPHLLEHLLSAGHCLKCFTWRSYNPKFSAKANES